MDTQHDMSQNGTVVQGAGMHSEVVVVDGVNKPVAKSVKAKASDGLAIVAEENEMRAYFDLGTTAASAVISASTSEDAAYAQRWKLAADFAPHIIGAGVPAEVLAARAKAFTAGVRWKYVTKARRNKPSRWAYLDAAALDAKAKQHCNALLSAARGVIISMYEADAGRNDWSADAIRDAALELEAAKRAKKVAQAKEAQAERVEKAKTEGATSQLQDTDHVAVPRRALDAADQLFEELYTQLDRLAAFSDVKVDALRVEMSRTLDALAMQMRGHEKD